MVAQAGDEPVRTFALGLVEAGWGLSPPPSRVGDPVSAPGGIFQRCWGPPAGGLSSRVGSAAARRLPLQLGGAVGLLGSTTFRLLRPHYGFRCRLLSLFWLPPPDLRSGLGGPLRQGLLELELDPKRLEADFRQILLCYKIQFRLKKLVNEITEKGPNKYWYLSRGRLLLWALLSQAVLNHPDLEDLAERFGRRMSIEADYTEILSGLATTRCRPLLSDLTADSEYASKVADDNLGFLRTNAAFKRCMEIAYKKWKWVEKKLK